MNEMLHPRNRHQGRYDFEKLKLSHPELAQFVAKNKYGDDSIDFSNAEAVKVLNRALLKDFYGIIEWDIPPNALCPPIPGRADYIHSMADVLALYHSGVVPRGPEVKVLDIGVGANCIYPIIGHYEYAWSFVGADINPLSLESAKKIRDANPSLKDAIEFRLQANPQNIFSGIVESSDQFDFTMCNPPFHASLEEAQSGSKRKWQNLGLEKKIKHEKQLTNFGGQGAELWCEGGELAFIGQMIDESGFCARQCFWFSTLVSRSETLPEIYARLKKRGATEWKTLDMAQGQKKSRVVAWTFQK